MYLNNLNEFKWVRKSILYFNILFNISSKFFDLVTFHATPMFQKNMKHFS